MSFRPRHWTLPCLLATVAGCAQSGPLLSQRATGVGTLKTSLSHLEFENQQLRKKVATLEAENRQVENDLVQEQSHNGEISARLDDAKAMLKRRGLDGGELAETNPSEADADPPRTTLPAARSNKKKRKPPFAQIPGRIDVAPPPSDDGNDEDRWGSSGSRPAEESGPQSRADGPTVWLPVARGASEPTAPLR